MAFDGIILKNIVNELQYLLEGKVNKIYQPNKNEIAILIYAQKKNYTLNLCINPNFYRINLTTTLKPNPLNAYSFCMLLRKHLIGAKIKKIYTNGLERIVYINFECYNELSDIINKQLIVELMGKHSNIILLNSNNRIIDSLRHLSTEEHSTRNILPSHQYVNPKNEKADFLQIKTFDDFYKSINGTEKLDSAISSTFTGISSSSVKSIEENLNISNELTTSNIKLLYKALQNATQDTTLAIENYKNTYSLSTKKRKETSLENNFFLDSFYSNQEQALEFKSRQNTILKQVSGALEKVKQKIININNKLNECKKMDTYKLYGELITSNLYQFSKFDNDTVTMLNYYDGKQITIPVDKNKTPSYNAKHYYKKYNKLKNALLAVSKQKKVANVELEYIESILYEINTCKNTTDLIEIEQELEESELFEKFYKINKKPKKKKKEKHTNVTTPTIYKINDYTLYVGKNNIQNDYLTTKMAKNHDIWFHTKDIHGSHAILETNGDTPDIITLTKCAEIAAFHSKAKLSSKVPVDYTLVKYVKKPSGSKPGFVIYTHNKTLYVMPKKP